MSVEPFKRLVRLVARALYDDEIAQKPTNPGKSNKSDNKGIAVVVLDALTRRTWVKEEELAKCLKLHPKQLRRTLRTLEEEMLIVREDHKETVKAAKAYNAAIAVTTDAALPAEPTTNEKTKVLVHSYCCLDYAQVCDVVRYRIHRAKKKIKDQLEDKNTVQEYLCPNVSCARRYSALDASRLISADGNFHCERCDAELVAENDKLAPKELADGDSEEGARRRQREKLKEMLERMEVQLRPLVDQLAKLKDVRPPVCLPFTTWQEKVLAQRPVEDGGDKGSSDRPGVPMPFVGETKVMVEIGGDTGTKDAKKEDTATAMKVLPPWMIRQGMELTAQQRGEVKKEENGTADQKPVVRDVKPANDEKSVEAEYAKAFYEAYMKQQLAGMQQQEQQQQQVSPVANGHQERQVGVKAKREPDEEEIVWEEGPSAVDGGAGEQANEEAPAEADDDEIDWE